MAKLESSPAVKMLLNSTEEPTIKLFGNNCNNAYDLELRNDYRQYLISKNVISGSSDICLFISPPVNNDFIIWKNVSNDDNINNDILNLEEQPNLEELDQLAEIRREPLSNDEMLKVDAELRTVLTTKNMHKIVTNKFNIDMTRNKIRCLIPYTWLNDEVINFYMCLLQQRDNKFVELEERKLSSHYFNSFFVVKMYRWLKGVRLEYNYDNIKNWTKNFNVFKKDKIFIPININDFHWTLIIVYIELKIIHYYDSLNGRDSENHMIHVLKWLKDESKEKHNNSYHVKDEEWQLIDQGEVDLPRQGNGYDCGVFVVLYADFRSDNIPWGNSFQQSEILSYRKKICAAILRGDLLY